MDHLFVNILKDFLFFILNKCNVMYKFYEIEDFYALQCYNGF